MSHIVALTAPQSAAHTVKRYAGFGILGAGIPNAGDNGGSPALNDGISPTSEYYWRIVTQPGSGTLTIHPDLSFDLEGAADGTWSWQYRLYEDGANQGLATVNVHVGAYTVLLANSQQANQATTVAIQQTHLVSASASQQFDQAAAAAIHQIHLVGTANSQQVNTGVAASVSQSSISFVSSADAIQINQADAVVIRQMHLVGVASSQQQHVASDAVITQAVQGILVAANSQQVNQTSAAAIIQTHRVAVASSLQTNRSSSIGVSDSLQPIGGAAASLIISARQATRVGLADSSPNALLREVDLSNFYYKGGSVRLYARIAGDDDADFDPAALTLKTRFDGGPVTVLTYGVDAAIVRDRIGRYHADIDLLGSGTFHFRWEASSPNGAAEGKIPVASGRFS